MKADKFNGQKFLYLDKIYESKTHSIYRTRTAEERGYIVCDAHDDVNEYSNPSDYKLLHNWIEIFNALHKRLQKEKENDNEMEVELG